MRTTRIGVLCFLVTSLIALPMLVSRASGRDADDRRIGIAEDEVLYEFIGQVKNSPPAAPGLPPTSVQYGYLTLLREVDKVFTTDDPTHQNEKTARFTFYNDSVTQRVITHGNLLIINREGTSTIYFNENPTGDLTTPNPDSFRSGKPILSTTWRHQVIFEPPPLTGHFFVHFENVVTSTDAFEFDGRELHIGRVGNRFRVNLVGDSDPAGKVNGKFAGYAVGLSSRKDDHDDRDE
jgi:hypothetical protein